MQLPYIFKKKKHEASLFHMDKLKTKVFVFKNRVYSLTAQHLPENDHTHHNKKKIQRNDIES